MTRNVADLNSDERQVFERVLGHQLENNQRLVVQISVMNAPSGPGPTAELAVTGDAALPESYRLFKDLSDDEVAELEADILQRSDSRPS